MQSPKQKRTALLLAGLVLVAAGALAQSVVYVKTADAEIRGGTGLNGPVLEKVKQGTALNVVSSDKTRFKVSTPSGNQGYVSRLKVTDSPPGKGGIGTIIRNDTGPQEMRTSSGGRGLNEEPAEQMAQNEGVNPAAIESVHKMEQLAGSISDADVDRFLVDGGFNP